jgi:uncharacterized OB-fold protein
MQLPYVEYLSLDDPPHLIAKVCTNCRALYLDRRNACAQCGQDQFSTRVLTDTGVVRAFTIVHRATPGVPVPYVSAVVDLDGGGVVKANLIAVEPTPDAIELGMRVRMTTFVAGIDSAGTEAIGFCYQPEEAQRA